jgi:uncharacterized cupredoxin-like copper-binding protein
LRKSLTGSVFALLVVLGTLALAASAFGGPAKQAAKPQKVTVNMTDFKFALKPKSVKKGKVTFTAVNKGAVAHDFKILGKKTKSLATGKKQAISVTFKKAGKYAYVCTLPGHAAAGMKGTLVVK